MCPTDIAGRCESGSYRLPSHFLGNKAFQTQRRFQIRPFRMFLPGPNYQGTRESDKVPLILLRVSRFAESPKASKFWVEDSIMNTWMSGGYMVRMEGNLKTR